LSALVVLGLFLNWQQYAPHLRITAKIVLLHKGMGGQLLQSATEQLVICLIVTVSINQSINQ